MTLQGNKHFINGGLFMDRNKFGCHNLERGLVSSSRGSNVNEPSFFICLGLYNGKMCISLLRTLVGRWINLPNNHRWGPCHRKSS